MKRLKHNLRIKETSWHARLYNLWLSLGGKAPKHRENLCHYVRVVVFWAPVKWFFKGRIKQVVPPWSVALVTAFISFAAIAFYLWPDVSLKVLIGCGIALAAVALLGGGLLIYDNNPERAKKLVLVLTVPIWGIPFLLILAGTWVWEKIGRKAQAFGSWFVNKRLVFRWVSPFSITAVGSLIALAIFATGFLLQLLLVVASVLAGVGAFVLTMLLGDVVQEKARQRRWAKYDKPPTRLKRTFDGALDTVKLGATYAATKKRGSRICPFIEFEQSTEPTTS